MAAGEGATTAFGDVEYSTAGTATDRNWFACTIDPSRLDAVVSRSRLFHPSTLAFVPANVPSAQEAVLQWADADTEQIPDHIWVASAAGRQWNTDEIMDWCEDPARWTNLASVAQQPAERLLIPFDRQISCSLPSFAADAALSGLAQLAVRWNLSVVEGRADGAWVAHRSCALVLTSYPKPL